MISLAKMSGLVGGDNRLNQLSVETVFPTNGSESNGTNITVPEPFLNASVWGLLWQVHPNISQIGQAVGLACVTLIGIVGNLLLLSSLSWVNNVNRNLLAVMTSLSLCDLLVCFMLPYDAYLIVTGEEIQHVPCAIQGMIIIFPGLLKNLNMIQFCLLCYMMVWNPTQHFKFQRTFFVNLCIVSAWGAAAGFAVIPVYWFNSELESESLNCDPEELWSTGYKMLYLTHFFFTAIFYMVVILFVQCGIHKLKAKLELNSRRRKCKRQASEVKRKNHIHQAVTVSIASLVLFAMTVPYHCALCAHFVLDYKILPDVFVSLSHFLSVLHVTVNPIIYACHVRRLTDAYLRVVRYVTHCRCSKCCGGGSLSGVAGESSAVRLHTMSLRRPVSGSVLRLHTAVQGGRSVSIPRIVVTDFDQRDRRVNADLEVEESDDVWCSSATADFFSESLNCSSSYDLSHDTESSGNFLEVPANEWE